MKKNLRLIAAIIISLTSSNAHATVGSELLTAADVNQAQAGGNERSFHPNEESFDLYVPLDYNIACRIMSFLNTQEASRMAATSRSNWETYERLFPGLILDVRVGYNDYVERFKGRKMFSHDHPFVSERFVQEMFKRYPTLKDPSVLQTVKGFFKKQLAKENPDLDTLTQIITRHYSVFCTIMDEQHIEGFDRIEPQLRPYVNLREQLRVNVNDSLNILNGVPQMNLKAFGYMVIASSHADDYSRVSAAGALVKSWGEYKDQAAQACLAIAQDATVYGSDRIFAVRAFARLGDAYKPQMAQAWLAIGQDATVNSYYRISAAEALFELGDAYKPEMAQVLCSIAQNATDSRDRICAARALAKLGGDYKNQAITIFESMKQTQGVINLLTELRNS